MLASVPDGAQTVVVDNASDDLDALRDLCAQHGTTLIESDTNLGFGVACNLGANDATTEFLLFLNPDAELLDGALEALVASADEHTKASAFNPRIESPTGRPFFKRKSSLLPRTQWMARGWPAGDQEVTILSGAALFVRRTAFEAIAGFDPNIFLFHEDDDLALRLSQDAGPLRFVEGAHVRHGAGSSSGRTAEIARLKAWHMGHSKVYAMAKHKMPLARTKSVLGAGLALLSPINWANARKRAKCWALFSGVVNASLGGKASDQKT